MDRNLPEGLKAIEHFAASSPQAAALIIPDGKIVTYRELWSLTTAVGKRLRESGIGAQETVAILAAQGQVQVIAVTGVLDYCACAPLQPRTVIDEVRTSLRRLSASALIASPEFAAEAEAALEMGLVVVHAHPDQPPEEWEIAQPRNRRKLTAASSDAVLYLMTSATTGTPRIVPLSATNLNAPIQPRIHQLRLTASDRQLLMTSLCHRMGIEDALAQFASGGSVIATGGFDSTAFGRWLEVLRPTWYDCAPTIHEAILAELKKVPPPLPVSLRFVQSAGGVLSRDTKAGLESVLKVPVFNHYGMTEAGSIVMDAFLETLPEGSAGRTFGFGLSVLNTSGESASCGEQGEIAVRGPAVFSGYLDDPEADRAAFLNGWFRTGDAGRLDADGNLSITGRLKEMINRGGEKISPAEVDAALNAHPAVREAAAFAVPHPTLGEDVACAVVLRPERTSMVTAIELRRFMAERLARFKIPHHIYFVDAIPRGELGKPQRWLLAEKLGKRRTGFPMSAEVEDRLMESTIYWPLHEIWARILECDDLDADDDFFEAGGDSLAAINMLAEVDQRFGCNTSAQAAAFLDEPILENLVRLAGKPAPPRPSKGDPSDIRIFPVGEGGAGKTFYCIPTDEHEGLYFRRLAKHLVGKMDLDIVRPYNTFHNTGLYALEREGRETAQVIRQAQPKGPYLVGGYCYGGAVAVETARNLAREGQDVRVVLFDVPTPGVPGIVRDWKFWLGAAQRQWHRLWTSKHPGLTRNTRRFARHLTWALLVPLRRVLLRAENVPLVQRMLDWAQDDQFPLYALRPVDATFLHFLCTDESAKLETFSRYGWRKIAKRGMEERFLPATHHTLFLEPNLPEMVETLLQWIGEETPGKRADAFSQQPNDETRYATSRN